MAYKHLTINELIWIEEYFKFGKKISEIVKNMKRSRQTVYNVVNFLKAGGTAEEFWTKYHQNKKKCGAKKKNLSKEEQEYVRDKLNKGWTPDTIIGRGEINLRMSVKTLYRRFSEGVFEIEKLPMKGRRKPNNFSEKRGKQGFVRTIRERDEKYPLLKEEFGHLEGDTIVGRGHKSSVITLVEVLSKYIVVLKPEDRTALSLERRMSEWLGTMPRNFYKSMTFDRGKEFSNWKDISNKNDIEIFFADSGSPGQRGLNENSNGLLRRDGLAKQTDFREMEEEEIISVAEYRNNIPRKSLGYRTPKEVFNEYLSKSV